MISLKDKRIPFLVFEITNTSDTSFVPRSNKNNLSLYLHMTVIPYLLCICFNINWVIIIIELHQIIDQQYVEDISCAAINAKHKIEEKKKKTHKQLKKRNLQINEEKTEYYPISKEGDEKRKTCKLVGSLLDIEKDLNRRKTLSICTHNKLKYILESTKNTIKTKVKVFNAFVRSIFMYNSELWTLTKKLENTVDIFQRLLLRRIINVKWQNRFKIRTSMNKQTQNHGVKK